VPSTYSLVPRRVRGVSGRSRYTEFFYDGGFVRGFHDGRVVGDPLGAPRNLVVGLAPGFLMGQVGNHNVLKEEHGRTGYICPEPISSRFC
jgi:hypothetical protein